MLALSLEGRAAAAASISARSRSWLEKLIDRAFGSADFLVGLLAEHTEDRA